MKPLVIAVLTVLLPVAPLFASPSDTHKDDIMLPVLHDDPTGPNYVDVMNQATQAISDVKRKSREQNADAEKIRAAAKAAGPSNALTFDTLNYDKAANDFVFDPDLSAHDDIEPIWGRWVLSAYTDSLRGFAAPAWVKPQSTLEFSHEGYRYANDKSWRAYGGTGREHRKLVEKDVVAAPSYVDEYEYETLCRLPRRDEMLCQTYSTHTRPGTRLERRSIESYAKYTRAKE